MTDRLFPRRMTRAQKQWQTRERLIDSARGELARRGVSASIREIAEAAGLTQGALYANFSNKDALFIELMRRHMREEVAELNDILENADHDPVALIEAIRQWVQKLNKEIDWSVVGMELQLQVRRSPQNTAEYVALYHEHCEAVSGLVRRLFVILQRQVPVEPEAIAICYIALAYGMTIGGYHERKNSALIMLFLSIFIYSVPMFDPKSAWSSASA